MSAGRNGGPSTPRSRSLTKRAGSRLGAGSRTTGSVQYPPLAAERRRWDSGSALERRSRALPAAAGEIARRLGAIFLPDAGGRRPVFGYHPKAQGDPHFRDLLLFNEYFHGDLGWGVGAARQTGWTALVADLLG